MKKTLIALAVLAVSGTAFAQSTATISGSISVGVMDTGLANAKAAVASLGGGANAINIVTAEDLGGGMRAGFDSQMRFSSATGDRNSNGTGAALFHGANAYISGGMGTIRVGKIIEANNCAFDPWACTGGAGTNAGAPGTISALIAAGTIAQSVSYATPTVGGFNASYHTSVSSRNNERSVMSLNYSQGPLLAQFLQSKNSANVGGDVVGGAPSIKDEPGQGTSMGARYNFGFATLSAFNAKTENAAGTVTADITAFTATVPMGAYTLLASSAKNKKAAATADTKTAVGINYALSKRTTVGADMFKQDAVGSSTGFVARVRHNF